MFEYEELHLPEITESGFVASKSAGGTAPSPNPSSVRPNPAKDLLALFRPLSSTLS